MRLSLAIAGTSALLLPCPASAWADDGREAAPTAPQSDRGGQTTGKRGEFVFVDAELGPTYVDVLALKDGDLLDTRRVKSGGFGLTYGAALGVRLRDFELAVRYRRSDLSDWQLSTLGGEGSMKFTLGNLAPHFGFGAGYASLDGTFADLGRGLPFRTAPTVDISGLNVKVHAGLDYYALSWFSVGASLSGDAFFLRRKGDQLVRRLSDDPNSPPIFPYAIDGSGNGLGATLALVLGLHY